MLEKNALRTLFFGIKAFPHRGCVIELVSMFESKFQLKSDNWGVMEVCSVLVIVIKFKLTPGLGPSVFLSIYLPIGLQS